MPRLLNVPITPPRVPMLDPVTGLVARDWYMFFYSLYGATGGTSFSVEDLQKGPSIGADMTPELQSQIDGLQVAPRFELGTLASLQQDNVPWLHFKDNPSDVPAIPGTIAWNQFEDTLRIYHTGNVIQQVGEEIYARIINTTGSTILNGTVVGLQSTGVVVPFKAAPPAQTLDLIGVMTQDAAPLGGLGRCTVWGNVNDLDTTGAPYGETWVTGQLLYVSPTIAGGYTKTKPTAPDYSLPIASVRVVSSTVGRLFVRPTIEQQRYYAVIVKTADQSPVSANTEALITFNTLQIGNGVSIGTPSSRIVVIDSGLYNFNANVQFVSNTASTKNVWFWWKKNGSAIAGSSRKVSISDNGFTQTIAINNYFSLQANDYIELAFASDDIDITIDNIASTAFAPEAPAIVLSVNQAQL